MPPTLLLALPTSLAVEESSEGEEDEENMQCGCVEGEKGLQGWRRKGVKRKRGGFTRKEVVGCKKREGWTRKEINWLKREKKRKRAFLTVFLLKTQYTPLEVTLTHLTSQQLASSLSEGYCHVNYV